LKNIIAKKLV